VFFFADDVERLSLLRKVWDGVWWCREVKRLLREPLLALECFVVQSAESDEALEQLVGDARGIEQLVDLN